MSFCIWRKRKRRVAQTCSIGQKPTSCLCQPLSLLLTSESHFSQIFHKKKTSRSRKPLITLLPTHYDDSLRIFLCHLMLWVDDVTTRKFTECSLSMVGGRCSRFQVQGFGIIQFNHRVDLEPLKE